MKKCLLITFVMCGCAVVYNRQIMTTVILDGSSSKIVGGDGSGYIKSWEWKQVKGQGFAIGNPSSMVTETTISRNCDCAWELTGVDNLGQIKKDTLVFKNGKLIN